jgi:adenylosuccinate lyase
MARLLRGYAVPAMENVALWHERDISHSSAERVILPDATILADTMLHRFTEIVRDLRIDEERVAKNLRAARSGYGSQALLLALARKGLSRSEAYRLVQGLARRAAEAGEDLEALLLADEEVRRRLTAEEIRASFSLDAHRKHVDRLLRRAGVVA